MPDGTRKRRFSTDPHKRRWYANHRSRRFAIRFGAALGPVISGPHTAMRESLEKIC